jgi:hypothetical protein
MKIKNLPFLIWDSVKNILNDFFDYLALLKKPKTWSFILYATVFLMYYYGFKDTLTWVLVLLLIIIIYIIRRSHEADFTLSIKKRAFVKGNEEEMRGYYQTYKKDCFYRKVVPLEYEEYKKQEKEKMS